jgi:acyl-CoA synthetase (NDP forming)
MGVITASGGACDIIADRASDQGIQIPPFAPDTAAAITPHLPPFATAHNPLDVTGYFLANQRTSSLTAIDHALAAALADPGLDFVLFSGVTIPDARPPDETMAGMLEERVRWLGERIGSAPIPVIPIGSTCTDVSAYGRELLARHNVHLLGGMDLGLRALGHALRWLENRGTVTSPAGSTVPPRRVSIAGTWSEAAARDLLAGAGVPVVPAELADSAGAAAAAARRLGGPVVLKVCSAQISHKSDIGGVALAVAGDDAVADAYRRVRAAGESVPGAVVEGVLVMPMRTGGVELLAGVTVDPAFGPVLAVGLGGLWVEVMADTALRLLPVTTAEVERMLGELRGAPLLRGARGSRPADTGKLARVISDLGDVALSLGDALRVLEVNPLLVNGDQIEALDVLIVTGAGGAAGGRAPSRRQPETER